MEIADYLKVARRRLWILLLVPVLAAGGALYYGMTKPMTYSATATVRTPGLVGTPYSQFNGPQAIGQFVSAFAASAADPTVVAQTAKQTGVSGANLSDNVTVTQVGASSNVDLTYSGLKESASQPVAQALAANALKNLYTEQARVSTLQVGQAKGALDAANKGLYDYVGKIGLPDPPAAYQAALSQQTWLLQAQAGYLADANTDAANAIKGPLTAANNRVNAVGATLSQYNALLAVQSLATSTYQSVLADQRKVGAQAAAAASADVIQTSVASPDMSTTKLVKLVVPIGGAAVLLAVIMVALLEFIGAVRRQPADAVVTRRAGLRSAERVQLKIGA